jgi:hypothetical protein
MTKEFVDVTTFMHRKKAGMWDDVTMAVGTAPQVEEPAAPPPDAGPQVHEGARLLELLAPKTPWNLCAFATRGGGPEAVVAHYYDVGPGKLDGEKGLSAWIKSKQERPKEKGGPCNLYLHVAAGPDRTRLRKIDVIGMRALFVDLDPVGEDGRYDPAMREAIIPQRIRDYARPPSVVVDSGNGFQCYWLLDEPYPITGDPLRFSEFERYTRQLCIDFETPDSCFTVDHLLALPGTIKLATEKKLGKGYPPGDRPARIVEWHPERRYKLEDFPAAPPIEEAAQQDEPATGFTASANYDGIRPDDPGLKGLDAKWLDMGIGGDASEYDGDRSDMAFAFATAAKRAGIADEILARCLMDPAWKIGECIRDKGGETKRQLKRLIERAGAAAVDKDLAEMNDKHCVIDDVGGVCVIVNEAFDLKRKRAIVTFSTFGALRNRYANKKKLVGTSKEGDPIYQPLAEWWIHHPRHRQYNQVTFAPNQDVQGAFNVWRGFSVEPMAGDCSLYLAHVHDHICGGDEKVYAYVLDWMANGMQRPDKPGRTAISLRGDPGAGKGVFVLGYGQIFGRHFLQVTQPDHLTGKFNAHEGEAVLVYADEVAFSGDPKAARVFKTKISEETKLLERKGFDAIEVDNYARYIFSTNEGHPLQIEHNDRRYLALKVLTNPLWATEPDKQRAADLRHEYFQPIVDQMDRAGRAALLRMLLDRDISKFNPEAFPRTAEIGVQKLLSAPAGDKIIIDFARDGLLPGALAKRPWIAPARGEGNLFDTLQRRGDLRMRTCAESHLADIIKAWGFTQHPLGYAAGWAAPSLSELRAAIDSRYPGIVWDSKIAEWRQGEHVPF